MSDEATEIEATGLLGRASPVMLVSMAVGAGLFALLAIVSFVLMLTLSSDISRLDAQIHKMSKVLKNMEQDMAQLRSSHVPVAIAKENETKPTPAPIKPSHMDAADAKSDCVVRSGSKGAFADCLK
jgi:cell division protein FtsL